jgi:hypothetical protein
MKIGMKQLICSIFSLLLFVSTVQTQNMNFKTDDYAKEWADISKLENDGLPKSALEKVEALLSRAKRENNPSQVIKTLIYRSKYTSQLEEEGFVKVVNTLRADMDGSEFPIKPILQSMLAEMLTGYVSNNIWKFRGRSTTVNFKNDDITTWTIAQLNDESALLYRLSVNDDKSQQVPIKNFNAVTTEGDDNLRPTLYDFLAHRAIDFFMDEKSYLTQPAYKFDLDTEGVFAPVPAFLKIEFGKDSRDSNAAKLWTLRLMQDVLRFHQRDNSPEALLNADLKRLEFAYENAVIDNKEDAYIRALESLRKEYANNPGYVEIALKLAQLYRQKGLNYKPNPEKIGKDDNRKALEILREALQKYPKAYGAKGCRELIDDITTPSVEFRLEEVSIPNKPILASVSFKNVDTLHYKIIRLYEKTSRRDFSDENERLKFYTGLPHVKRGIVDLPNDGDYHVHVTEMKIDKLPLGYYLVLASDNAKYSLKNGGKVSYATFHVSNLAYWHRSSVEEPNEFVVLDRTTGAPLMGVTVEFWENRYNSQQRKDVSVKIGNTVTDKSGFAYTRLQKEKYFTTKFIYGKDSLSTGDGFSNYVYKRENRVVSQTIFFLDRAIYRPGQTIYYKALVYDHNTEGEGQPEIVVNTPVEITFFDANGQKVASQKLTTNSFGTVNGFFTAPMNGLLGQMRLQSSLNGTQYFRVEEYKRPKFEVKMPPLEGDYVLNQTVKVKGLAKAFAGSNIDGAKVKYRVVREVRYPYWRWWFPIGNNESQEIAHGETMTDSKGEFEIPFKALPNLSIAKSKKPIFTYTVYADVTDITGETHTANSSVSIGYIGMNVTIDVPEEINKRDMKNIRIQTQNLNGQGIAAKGAVKIDLLASPRRPYVNRYWAVPDTHIIAEDVFRRDFPLIPYKEEDKVENWVVKKTILETTFNTPAPPSKSAGIDTSFISLADLKKYLPGVYRITITAQDASGEKIEVVKHVLIYDTNDMIVPANKTFFAWMERPQYQPKETAILHYGTAVERLNVLIEEEVNSKIVRRSWHPIEGMVEYLVKLTEEHRGNMTLHVSYVLDNRSTLLKKTVYVPYTNKELDIEYQAFRDKLLPGEEEEWRLKISGKNKDKFISEVVATLYDASLDQFAEHNWWLNLYPEKQSIQNYNAPTFGESYSNAFYDQTEGLGIDEENRKYRVLNWFGFYFGGHIAMPYPGGIMTRSSAQMPTMAMDAAPAPLPPADNIKAMKTNEIQGSTNTSFVEGSLKEPPKPLSNKGGNNAQEPDLSTVRLRANLNETAFFFPQLMTDAEGNLIVKFKMAESLTRWKFLALAHTTDLKIGKSEKTVVTQKDLMLFPNAPRFMREGDSFEFTAKVSNLTNEILRGSARLEFFDALTMKNVDALVNNTKNYLNFEVKAGESTPLAWQLKIPFGKVQALTYRIVAKAGNFSDGEENTLPVLTNRMMMTETLPLSIRGGETKKFSLDGLKNMSSTSLTHHRLSLEFTQNPAWYAVQALPYLMEYPYDCTEQIFSRYYANALASSVANSHPKIKAVFDRWKNIEPKALMSNLSKNQELKYALLEETPWVMQAQNEETQKKNIGLLFDLNRMSNESATAIRKMQERQLDNGGFAWFPGGRDSWYITQYITEGLGHLDKLGVKPLSNDPQTALMVNKAIQYCDDRIAEYYRELEKEAAKGRLKMEEDHLSSLAIHYLYTRSFFPKKTIEQVKIFEYFLKQGEKYWNKKGLYEQGLLALALLRYTNDVFGKFEAPTKIVASLKERAIQNPEMGMYWKQDAGYYWHQAPIETQALMIELFHETRDEKVVDELKLWLLKNKQTNAWKTTKATASAVYALLSTGANWLLEDNDIQLTVGGNKIATTKMDKEAGTGYFKTQFKQEEITPQMANVEVTNPNKVVAWGALYWQYFENLDKIKDFRETPLTLKKQLFKSENSDKGVVIKPLDEKTPLSTGDKLTVRIELRVDRDMEFVHMKDMRAAGFEPVNVLSQYKWQGGLGYYESTRDAATNFFFDYLPKGTYVFEYPLVVNHRGDMSNGVTTIQCMYAPEFTSHSEGIRVSVK